ncbi:hypothetical protein AVEN_247216-1 [Araneus ventricosus]|uniref:Alpha-latrotoxin n=1 Tax=Araneus ventricosus TaxID=182803 RepID=A0A4Y2EQL4_ARAVE|nr:hypothetical protein AVEN_247216-1 [Araneus ventricosus]
MDYNVKQSLHELVKSDDNIALVRKLLARGADPNFENSNRETLLHEAAKSTEDNIGIVQELIKAGADANRCDCFLFKPLHIAVIFRKRRVVEALLQSKIRINSRDSFGKTALHYSVNNNHFHTVRFGVIPPHAQVPDLWIVKKLLDHKHINVNIKDLAFETPLMRAVKDKNIEIVKLFLNQEPRLDDSNKYGQTALHMALTPEYKCPCIVVLLLLKRASLLKMNSADQTPLDIIINSGSFHFRRIFLKVIAFTYHINGLLMKKVFRIPELSQFLSRCCDEINHMKRDIIADELTVFDFCCKSAPIYSFRNPILQIYKPVVERIITGLYPEYFCYILHRISKSNLSAVLKVAVVQKYCKKNCDDRDCKKMHPTAFSEVVRLSLLYDYLSILDIFRLIVIFSSVQIDESMLTIREHECYLTDSWEEYPDKYFY